MCAAHFVNEVLPFLAMVVIQDGVFWIHDYPDSLPSRLLLDRMRTIFPGYATWATAARQDISRQARSVGQVQVDTLNATAQRAFNMMVSKMDVMQQQQAHNQQQQHQQQQQQQQHHQQQQQHQQQMLQLLQQQQQQHQQQHQQLLQLLQQQQREIQVLSAQQQRNNYRYNDNDNDNVDVVDNNNNNDDDDDNDDNNQPLAPIYPPPPPRPIYNVAPIVIAAATTTGINVNDALQNAPTIPPIPTQLPKTLLELVRQHYENRLEQYNNSCKAHWPSKIQQAFSKRKYLFNHIQLRAARLRGPESIKTKMMLTASSMDQNEMANGSVDKFLNNVRNSDPSRKRRNRVPRQQRQQQLQQQQHPGNDGFI